MQQPYTAAGTTAANALYHRVGHDVNAGDQLASPVLLGIAVAGAAVALLLCRLVIG